ncbi:MAG: hypothetical protein KAR42_06435 [candidate division Zixibacteria bacterium]|nr:hypothetical protein [candidate division Zixibacteria bacterium]
MGDFYKITTGSKQNVGIKCACGNRCPVLTGFRLQKIYFHSLSRLDSASQRWSKRLENARFVHEVAKAAAKAKEIGPKKVWKEMRPKKAGGSDATKFEETFLSSDIKKMEDDIKKKKKAAENAAQKLVQHISQKTFQRHLYKYHRDHQISPQTALDVYDYQLDDTSSDKKKFKLREIDHYLAMLTEHLAATENGQKLLKQLLDKDFIKEKKNIAFADVWGYTKHANSLVEPVGKFLYNVSPVITAKVQTLINDGKVKTIDDILSDPDLKEHFGFLKKKLNMDVAGWLKKRANAFSGKSKAARDAIQKRNDFKSSIKQFQDVFDDLDAKKKIDSAWVGLTFDIISFGISIVKITSDFKKAKWTDWMGMVGDFTGLVKTVGEVKTARILLVSGKGESLAAAKAFTKRLGVLAGVASIIISIAEIYKGVKEGDWDVVALNSAGLLITGAGIYAACMEAALMSGICAILAVILAIITALVLDPKVIDYLEDTCWGEDYRSKVIPYNKSIYEYYKRMFSIKVRFELNTYDSNNSHILVECGMMSDYSPVFLEVINEKSKKSLGKKRVFPKYTSVRGKGEVKKEGPSWAKNWPFYDKRIQVVRPWEVWDGAKGIQRDNSTKYTILAGMDPSRSKKVAIKKMAQNESTTGITFPTVQEPILQRYLDNNKSFYGKQVYYYGSGSNLYVIYPSSGKISLNVYTRYGGGCKVNVRATEDRTWPIPNRSISNTKYDITGDETTVRVPIKPPPSDSYYELWITMTLLNAQGKAVKSISPANIRIAYKEYIDRKKR